MIETRPHYHPGGVLVANPGYSPELRMTAAALARAGLLDSYMAPFAYGGRPGRLVRTLPAALSRRIEGELSRRSVPESVAARAVRRGSLLEGLTVLALRAGFQGSLADRLQVARGAFFDRQVSRILDGRGNGLVASYGAARNSLRRARELGLRSYLNFPIMHHRVAEQLLTEEAELQPHFAETLQFHQFPHALVSRWDEEIETAEYVLVPSPLVKRSFEDAGARTAKVLPLPLGVDVELFRPPFSATRHTAFRVIFVGQVTQRKGISYLFEAFRRAAMDRSELLLVGRVCGSDQAWRAMPRVHHLAPVPRRELPALYASADVFVMPSLVEGFCQTALEAMACGLPVIVSEHTVPGAVTDGRDGYLVPIRDADRTADRLVRLYDHPDEREAMGRAARRKALDYSWDRFGHRLLALLDPSLRGPT